MERKGEVKVIREGIGWGKVADARDAEKIRRGRVGCWKRNPNQQPDKQFLSAGKRWIELEGI